MERVIMDEGVIKYENPYRSKLRKGRDELFKKLIKTDQVTNEAMNTFFNEQRHKKTIKEMFKGVPRVLEGSSSSSSFEERETEQNQ